jgi:tetratricopeptide (TPR) repeat protein
VKKSPVVLFWLLLLAATSSSAVSLGRHRGAALIGRPLDISVQAVLDAQEDPAGLCLDADVFYADNKLAKSRVRVTAEKISASGPEALIRIQSSALVDEPVVTLYLRVGCQQKTEKRYVVLADMASEVAPGALPVVTPQVARSAPGINTGNTGSVAAQSANTSPGSDSSISPASAAADRAAARAARRKRSDAARSVPPTAPGAAATTAVLAIPPADAPSAALPRRSKKAEKNDLASAQNVKGGARLKLEPLDLTIERDPQLKSSSELLSAPLSTQERSAAAALWRALTAQPQDILRDAEKLQSLEESVRNLQVQAQKNRLAIDSLNGQVKQAQSERYANALVYILGVLLLIAVAALAYLLRRSLWTRNKHADEIPWWRKSEARDKGWSDSEGQGEVSSLSGSDGAKKASHKKVKKSVIPVLDLDLGVGVNESKFTEVKHISVLSGGDSLPPFSRREGADFAMSMTHPSRAVKAEELFDVQQQADFFVSLGQHEQAIEVLRSHIEESGETSALVYLDLFNLYHQLNRRDDYEVLREDFNRRFNGKIPAFDLYNDISPGLEAYQIALSRIEALWPSPKVLEVIEESIFRRSEAGAEPFDLEAYRELLMLYSVAKEIIHPDMGTRTKKPKFDLPDIPDYDDSRTTKFVSTSIQPLSASVAEDKPEVKFEPLLASVIPPASLNLGLDLDLSESNADDKTAAPVSAPEAESDADFFAQFSANMAGMSPPAASKPQALPSAAAESDNLIDFDLLDSSIGDDDKREPPKPPKSPKA